jgi:hypothetical protein
VACLCVSRDGCLRSLPGDLFSNNNGVEQSWILACASIFSFVDVSDGPLFFVIRRGAAAVVSRW